MDREHLRRILTQGGPKSQTRTESPLSSIAKSSSKSSTETFYRFFSLQILFQPADEIKQFKGLGENPFRSNISVTFSPWSDHSIKILQL